MAKRQSFSEREKTMNAQAKEVTEETADTVTEEVQEEVKQMQPVSSAIPTLKEKSAMTEEIEPTVPAVCDMPGLSDAEKEMLIESRIAKIFEASNLANPPALIKYSTSPSQPYVLALVDGDCMCIKDAWEYYKLNVASPDPLMFLDMLKNMTKKPVKVYQRVAEINLN